MSTLPSENQAPSRKPRGKKRGPKPGAMMGMKAARIEHICELMRTLKFRRGSSAKELAEQWDLSLQTIHDMTAAASRIVRAEVNDPNRLHANFGVTAEALLESIGELLVKAKSKPSVDWKSVFLANKMFTELSRAWGVPMLTLTSASDGTNPQKYTASQMDVLVLRLKERCEPEALETLKRLLTGGEAK